MECKKENKIFGYPSIIPFENIKIIIKQMEKCICQIKIGKKQGTGFFCALPFPNKDNMLPVFITNNHIINQELFDTNNKSICISIEEESNDRFLDLNNRIKYTSKEYDITIIEIKKKIT